MIPGLSAWPAELSRSMARVSAMFRPIFESIQPVNVAISSVAESSRSMTEAMRAMGKERAAAEETEKALAALPKHTLRKLTTTEVRCPGNELLVRVVRIPDHLPGAAYDTHLVLPKSGVTYQFPDMRHVPAKQAWFRADENTFDVRCRCHPGLTLTMDQLRGESPRPPEIRVLEL